jgi:hypothetical protein
VKSVVRRASGAGQEPRRLSNAGSSASAGSYASLQQTTSKEGTSDLLNKSGRQAPVQESVEDEEEENIVRYKVGCWDNRGRYFPGLEWAKQDKYVQDRFKALVEERNMNQIRILLHSGVSPNMPLYPMKRTPLHRAVELGDELLCQLLRSFKADPLLEDDNQRLPANGGNAKRSPMDLAEVQEQLHLMQLFRAHLGQLDTLDVGPDARLMSSEKPIRLHLRADEPCFMNSKRPFF